MDYVKLEHAITVLCTTLNARWVALTTLQGELIRYHPTTLDGDHIASLTHSIMMQSRHVLHDMNNGDFRYVLASGTAGTYLTFLLDGQYLLGINTEQLESFDGIVKAVPENVEALFALAKDDIT